MQSDRTRQNGGRPLGEVPSIFFQNGLVADLQAQRLVQANVAVEDGRIRDVLPPGAAPGQADQVVDLSGCVLVPGLINAHTHSYATLSRNLAGGLPLEPWMMHSWANTIGRTRDETRLSALLQGLEALKTGTTTLLDHLGGDVTVMPAALQAYADLGIRAVLAPMVSDIPLPDTLGVGRDEWPPGTSADSPSFHGLDADDLLGATEDLHKAWHGHADRLSVFLGPSAPQRCSRHMLEKSAEMADALGVGIHTHLLETRAQAALPPPGSERSWVALLESVGLLTRRLSVAHAVWLDDQDMDALARAGSTVTHNPQSNLQLGSGIGELPQWRRHGVRIALGTDGVNCGGSMDMLNSMRLAAVLHRPGIGDPEHWESPWSVLDLATRGGSYALSMADVGDVRPGMRADLAAFALDGTVFATHEDLLAALVLGSYDHRAKMVMVGGRVVLADGVVQTIDEREVLEQAADIQKHLLERNKGYAELAGAQQAFLTQLSGAAARPREIMTFHPSS